MREIQLPIPVKLFVGMLSPEPALFNTCADLLCKEYGPVDYPSESFPGTNSDYYREEMGPNILRTFIFFERTTDPGRLSWIKKFTNDLEKSPSCRECRTGFRRRINLDPGYVTEAKVVLASTKDFAHRVYIGDGIYAEVTLRYGNKDRSFTAFDHTYLDYCSETYITMFNESRELLRTALQRPARK